MNEIVVRPVRVAVIDSHTMTRYGLAVLIGEHSDLELVVEHDRATGAPAVIAEWSPHVVVLDVKLPDGDGLALARELRDRYPDLGIVLLTSDAQDDVLFRALENGVSAFVTKTAPATEVLAAIRHAAVAATSFTATGLAVALTRRATTLTGSPAAPRTTGRLALSPREREVLTLLGDGHSIPSIARSMYISHSTAKTYVARVYEKLGASNRAQALMAALRQGLIDQGLPTPA